MAVIAGRIVAGVIVPEGHTKNNPTLERWGSRAEWVSPAVTAERSDAQLILSRPFGTSRGQHLVPNAEALGYYRLSLRDTRRLAAQVELPNGTTPKPHYASSTRGAA